MRVFIVVTVAGLAALLWPGCDDHTPVLSGPGPVDTLHGPLEDYEAEAIAVNISGELVAPVNLYLRIERDLDRIRQEFGGVTTAVDIRYRSPWGLGRFTFKVDPEVLTDSTTATNRVFDSLNQIYRVVAVQFHFGHWFTVKFAKRYNPVRLVEVYSVVPGFEVMETGGFAGDGPDVYVQIYEQTANYFFREAWGDCPAGCIFQRVHYVSVNRAEYTYHGSHLFDYTDSLTPTPPWIDTFWTARQQKFYYITWYPDSVIYWP